MKKVLLVEDDPYLLRAMEIYLTGLGFKVQAYLNTASIVSSYDELSPDLGVFDVWVEPISGDKLCHIVKTELMNPEFPVILISAKNDLEKRAIQAQADLFLHKPFQLPDLGDSILKLMEQ
jgi:DNA-binding response OmpR family regulator